MQCGTRRGKRCIDPPPAGTDGGPHRLCGAPRLAVRPIFVGRLPDVGLVAEDDFDERREAERKPEFDLRFPREALGDPAE